MNDAQLRCFHFTAKEESFTRAAQALSLRQPTVSAQISTLEKGYGVRLFDRSSSRVALTPLGDALYEVTKRIYAAQADAMRLLTAQNRLETGHLRIGCVAPHHLLPVLSELRRDHPEVTYSINIGNSAAILEGVRRLHYDIGILANVALGDPSYHVQLLRRDQICILVPRAHPLAQRSAVDFADLVPETILLREEGSATRKSFLASAGAMDISFPRLWVMQGREVIKEAVACGLGVTPIMAVEAGEDPRWKIVALNAPCKLDEYILCQSETRARSPVVRAFLACAEELAVQARWRD